MLWFNTNNPIYISSQAKREYAVLRNSKVNYDISIANTGGAGTFGGHWRENVFGRELMTGYIDDGFMPLSRLTIA